VDQGYAEGARAADGGERAAAYGASGAGADCAGAVLQFELRLLQRVRQGVEPVPLDEMFRRIDHLGRLGTAMIGISGGEPLTHPELDEIIRRIRRTGAIAGMITNGYLLNVERIERLNQSRAGPHADFD
jgi:organic radical activating enzyme